MLAALAFLDMVAPGKSIGVPACGGVMWLLVLLSAIWVYTDAKKFQKIEFKDIDKGGNTHDKAGERILEARRISFAPQAAGNASALKDITEVCVAEGYLVQITDGIYLHADNEMAMREMVTKRLEDGKGLMVADIRDILATTRKYAVPLCEYLDRIGITRREGDLRYLRE